MTRASIQQYTEAGRGRYLQAKKKEKSQILVDVASDCLSPFRLGFR